jgi:fructokinase
MDLTCIGEILIDMFPAEVGRKLADVSAFHPKPGGAPANVAVAAARLGLQSAFVGKVGADAFGTHLIQTLQDEGVDTRGMRVDPWARTTLAFIAQPDIYHSEFVFYRNPGADLRLAAAELDQELLSSTRGLHLGSLSLVEEPARSATKEAVRLVQPAGGLVSFDVNYRPSLWSSPEEALLHIWEIIPHSNLLKVNEVEVALLTGVQADGLDQAALDSGTRLLLAKGPDLVVVTLGKYGSYFAAQDAAGFVPAFQVDTVDATGCGDAFVSGLLVRLLQGEGWRSHLNQASLLADLRYANAVGALTSLTQGVIPALPRAEKVQQFLAQSPATVPAPSGKMN